MVYISDVVFSNIVPHMSHKFHYSIVQQSQTSIEVKYLNKENITSYEMVTYDWLAVLLYINC